MFESVDNSWNGTFCTKEQKKNLQKKKSSKKKCLKNPNRKVMQNKQYRSNILYTLFPRCEFVINDDKKKRNKYVYVYFHNV